MKRAALVLALSTLGLPLLAGTAGAAALPVSATVGTSDGVTVDVTVSSSQASGSAGAGVAGSYGLVCVGFSYQVPTCVG